MLSQFFVLSPRGDVIIRRDFLGNVSTTSSEVFYRKLRFWKENDEAPPVFVADGVTYVHVKEGGVVLVATTKENISPSLVVELLKRIAVLIKDYCGAIGEEAIRKNFVLIYELLDEVLDYGFPQTTSTDELKSFVLSQPTPVTPTVSVKGGNLTFGLQKGATGIFKSVLDTDRPDGKRREEIFIDVIEKMMCVFSSSGFMQTGQIDGAIQVRSYLHGSPYVKIKLNDNVSIGHHGFMLHNDPVILDDCQFHESANLDQFELEKSISLTPAPGEFALMNYRCTTNIRPPFKVYTVIDQDDASPFKALVNVRIVNEIPKDKGASGLEVEIPMPKSVSRVLCESIAKRPDQTWDFNEKTHMVTWTFKSFKGGEDFTLSIRATLDKAFGAMVRREIGPVNVKFTIPAFCASRLNLQYLHISKKDWGYNPNRWVRYVTTSTSYTFRT